MHPGMTHNPVKAPPDAVVALADYIDTVLGRIRNPLGALTTAISETYGVNPEFFSAPLTMPSQGGVPMFNRIPLPLAIGKLDEVASPVWNTLRKSLPVGKNPTKKEMAELFKEEDTLRALLSKEGNESYFWPAGQALHSDIGAMYGLNPKQFEHALISR